MGLVCPEYEKQEIQGMFYCGGCGQFRDKNPKHPHRCVECAKQIVQKKAKRKRGNRRGPPGYTKHNLTPHDFRVLITNQKESCKICGNKTFLQIDHAHSCCIGRTSCGKCVRGLLCPECNSLVYHVEQETNKSKNMNPVFRRKIEMYLDNSGLARHKYR